MRNARLDEAQAGIEITGRNINNLRYGDDTMLMAETKEELKSFVMKVKFESEKAGLKMLNITHYQRNANQNHNEVPFHTSQNGWYPSLQAINAGEGVEKKEHSYTVGGNAN